MKTLQECCQYPLSLHLTPLFLFSLVMLICHLSLSPSSLHVSLYVSIVCLVSLSLRYILLHFVSFFLPFFVCRYHTRLISILSPPLSVHVSHFLSPSFSVFLSLPSLPYSLYVSRPFYLSLSLCQITVMSCSR